MKKSFFLLLVLLLPEWTFPGFAIAQQNNVPFTSDEWNFGDAEYTIETYKGKESLLLKKGFILLKDLDFLNGTIKVDVNFPEQRAFHDIAFRIQDQSNYESFYIRPHQSGNPDANQYTPVFNGLAGWQLYYGERYAVPINYEFDEWHTLKIVVSGTQAQIYFDDMEKPVLHIEELKRGLQSGSIGLSTNLKSIHFANFSYSLDEPTLLPDEVELPMIEENVVKNWQVSNVFPFASLGETASLDEDLVKQLSWNEYPVESEGFINLAKYSKKTETENTVITALDIYSETDQTKFIYFGFSDVVRVYLNNTAVFEGQNVFTSRDYRYLGTIGLFDGVYLPLKKGKNTLMFAIMENFGGWGLTAKFQNMDGISLTQ